MGFKEIQKRVNQNAIKKGFWQDYDSLNTSLHDGEINGRNYRRYRNNAIVCRVALIGTEIGEANRAFLAKNEKNFKEEVADIVIRCMDLAEGLGFNIENGCYQEFKNDCIICELRGITDKAIEALRKTEEFEFESKISDLVSRCYDIASDFSFDLDEEIKKKIEKNESRPQLHGKAF